MNEAFALRDVMRREFVGVAESDTLAGTVALLDEEGLECAVVMRGGEAVGLVTPSVVNRAVAGGVDFDTPVSELMITDPVVLGPADRLGEAAAMLGTGGPRAVVVADKEDVLGVLTPRGALDAIAARATDTDSPEPETPEPGSVAAAAGAEADGDEYARQSVCEACGSLAADLTEFNGQLLCPDCRDV